VEDRVIEKFLQRGVSGMPKAEDVEALMPNAHCFGFGA